VGHARIGRAFRQGLQRYRDLSGRDLAHHPDAGRRGRHEHDDEFGGRAHCRDRASEGPGRDAGQDSAGVLSRRLTAGRSERRSGNGSHGGPRERGERAAASGDVCRAAHQHERSRDRPDRAGDGGDCIGDAAGLARGQPDAGGSSARGEVSL